MLLSYEMADKNSSMRGIVILTFIIPFMNKEYINKNYIFSIQSLFVVDSPEIRHFSYLFFR